MSVNDIILGAAGGVADSGNWIDLLGGAGDDQGWSVTIDSSNNIYASGFSGSNLLIAKYNATGILQWQRTVNVGISSGSTQTSGITTDSSGNVYIAGSVANPGGSSSSGTYLVKYNSSGTLQFQRYLANTSNASDVNAGYQCIALDSSGNIYICGTSNAVNTSKYSPFVAKYNSSGTLQWTRIFYVNSANVAEYGLGLTVDSSNNIIVCGAGYLSAKFYFVVFSINSSGALNWQDCRYNTSTSFSWANSVAVDSSNNVYAAGRDGSYYTLVKYNSSGTLQWQRVVQFGSLTSEAVGVVVASDGYIYLTGNCSSSNKLLYVKYNSSGTLQFARQIQGNTGVVNGRGIDSDSSSNLYICGFTDSQGAGSNDLFLARLPNNGAYTGTYGNFTYSVASVTDTAGSMNTKASGTLSSTTNLTSGTPTKTSSTSTLTSTKIAI